MPLGLGIGEASPLKAKRRDQVVARTQLMLPTASGRLGPESSSPANCEIGRTEQVYGTNYLGYLEYFL